MSLHGFEVAMQLGRGNTPFGALIMAAMAKADTANVEKLREAWPDVWEELNARYNAPGGLINGEVAGTDGPGG